MLIISSNYELPFTLTTPKESQQYAFTDYAPEGKQLFYRLKQIDFDGKEEFLQAVEVSLRSDEPGIEAVSPNPVHAELTAEINMHAPAIVLAKVRDLRGQVLSQNSLDLKAGRHAIPMDVSELSAGLYFLEIQNESGGMISTRRFVKD